MQEKNREVELATIAAEEAKIAADGELKIARIELNIERQAGKELRLTRVRKRQGIESDDGS